MIGLDRRTLLGAGIVRLDGVSLSTATIPIVNDVRGEIRFDDLWTLTTPPGQRVTVGELNPGISVTNGRVAFQLISEQRVAIESAEFDFASGTLAMQPTTISLGADETRFELTLRDVDAAALLQTLSVPDMTATGKLEGSFPLLLTRRSAFVEHGIIRAQGEGGVLSYTGQAGDDATGVSRQTDPITNTNTTTGSVSNDRAGMAAGIDFSARLITLAINIALMGLVLLLGISHNLAHVLPDSTAMEWASLSQHIAAGKLDAPGLTILDAQTALRSGAGWAMLFAGLGACGLAMLSRHFFRRER